MKINFHQSKVFISYLFLILCSACINDSWDDCDASVCFHFYYDLNKQEKDRFLDEVDRIDLIICDEAGELYKIEEFNVTQSIHQVTLPYGKYRVIAWGNIHTDDYQLTGTKSTEDIRLAFVNHENNTVLSPEIGSLFFAGTQFEVNSSETQEIDLRMMKNTNHLKVIIKGLSEENNSKSYDVSITGKNHIYNHENLPPENLPTLTYTSKKTYEKEILIAEFDLLRLFTDDVNMQLNITKNIYDTTNILLNEAFIQYLIPEDEENPQYYLDKNDHYEMTVEFYGYKVRIQVGEWVYETNSNWLQ